MNDILAETKEQSLAVLSPCLIIEKEKTKTWLSFLQVWHARGFKEGEEVVL